MIGEFFINDVCAHEAYGLVLAKGAVASLLSPPNPKSVASNDVRSQPGVRMLDVASVADKREFSIEVAMMADDWEAFLQNRDSLLAELNAGEVELRTKYSSETYRCRFLGSANFSVFNGRLAKMLLKFVEPNPANR